MHPTRTNQLRAGDGASGVGVEFAHPRLADEPDTGIADGEVDEVAARARERRGKQNHDNDDCEPDDPAEQQPPWDVATHVGQQRTDGDHLVHGHVLLGLCDGYLR